jgi:hypothetical protein
LPVLFLGLVGCRQLLGLDEEPPLLTPDGGQGGAGGAGGAPMSRFSVYHAVPEGETLLGIWGAREGFFVAVGTSRLAFVYRDGNLMRAGGTEKGRDYLAVWGFAEDDIYAVGESTTGAGFVDHFDGVGWTGVYEAPTPLLGVWGTKDGTGAVIAVGVAGEAYGWHPGSAWQPILHIDPGPNDPAMSGEPRLWGISGRSIDDWAIAADSRVYHLEGSNLAYYELTTENGTLFRSLWQTPDPQTSIYLGTNFFGLYWFSAKGNEMTGYPISVLSRDETVPDAANAFIQGVWGTGERVVAVGDQGRIYAYDTGTATVSQLVSPTDEPLGGVWGSSIDDVWIVGRRELILHGSVR